MICPKCGAEIKDGVKFCTKCGVAFETNKNQTNTAQATTDCCGALNKIAHSIFMLSVIILLLSAGMFWWNNFYNPNVLQMSCSIDGSNSYTEKSTMKIIKVHEPSQPNDVFIELEGAYFSVDSIDMRNNLRWVTKLQSAFSGSEYQNFQNGFSYNKKAICYTKGGNRNYKFYLSPAESVTLQNFLYKPFKK